MVRNGDADEREAASKLIRGMGCTPILLPDGLSFEQLSDEQRAKLGFTPYRHGV